MATSLAPSPFTRHWEGGKVPSSTSLWPFSSRGRIGRPISQNMFQLAIRLRKVSMWRLMLRSLPAALRDRVRVFLKMLSTLARKRFWPGGLACQVHVVWEDQRPPGRHQAREKGVGPPRLLVRGSRPAPGFNCRSPKSPAPSLGPGLGSFLVSLGIAAKQGSSRAICVAQTLLWRLFPSQSGWHVRARVRVECSSGRVSVRFPVVKSLVGPRPSGLGLKAQAQETWRAEDHLRQLDVAVLRLPAVRLPGESLARACGLLPHVYHELDGEGELGIEGLCLLAMGKESCESRKEGGGAGSG